MPDGMTNGNGKPTPSQLLEVLDVVMNDDSKEPSRAVFEARKLLAPLNYALVNNLVRVAKCSSPNIGKPQYYRITSLGEDAYTVRERWFEGRTLISPEDLPLSLGLVQ